MVFCGNDDGVTASDGGDVILCIRSSSREWMSSAWLVIVRSRSLIVWSSFSISVWSLLILSRNTPRSYSFMFPSPVNCCGVMPRFRSMRKSIAALLAISPSCAAGSSPSFTSLSSVGARFILWGGLFGFRTLADLDMGVPISARTRARALALKKGKLPSGNLFHREERPARERNIIDTSESTCANDRGVSG
jgi:hypothetical protein